MATGTIRDPFEDYLRPVCGEFVEIGQPTFAELIWAREVTTRATSGADPDVATALRILAYGKVPRELPEMREQGMFTSSANVPIGQESAKYTMRGPDAAKAYKEKVKGLGIAKSSVDFRKLISNDVGVVPELISPQADNCAMVSGNNAPIISPTGCPSSDCRVDACFSIDISGSMQPSISAVKTGAAQMANLISQVSEGSYRFALSHFGQFASSGNLQIPLPLTTQNCGNISAFQSAVNALSVGGSVEPWHQPMNQIRVNSNTNWTFREDSNARILFIITDESEDVVTATALAAATEMGRCGIRLGIIWTSSQSPYAINHGRSGYANEGQFFTELANRTNGIWVHAPNGANIVSLMTSFIISVCVTATADQVECPGGENKILNGKFETSIASWVDQTSLPGRSTTWDSGFQAMQTSGAVSQTVTGLIPGDLATVSFDVFVETNSGVGQLDYELRDGSDVVLASGSITEDELQPNGLANSQQLDLFTTIQTDGEIKVYFNAENGGDTDFFIDNIVLCVLKEDDCGSGARNTISNPNFENGVSFWTDASNVALPTTDSSVWDSVLNAIIISLTGEPEVRTQVTGLTPGKNYSLNFELASFEPDVIGTLEFIYGVTTNSGSVIEQDTILRSGANPPERLQIDFQAPANGTIRVFFKGGITSGVAKVRNVLLCDSSGDCGPGFTKISFNDFTTSRGAWAGGTYSSVDQSIILSANGGNDTLSQTFSSLDPGSLFQITLNVLNGDDGVGTFQVELRSGTVTDQFNTNGTPGFKTYTTFVQSTGIVNVRIENVSNFDAPIDDILCCQQNAPPCDGSITNLEVIVEWNGIPRKPVNVFNAVVRYTIRDPNDPFSVTTVTHLPEPEGALGIASCDRWKQQGQGGNTQSGILGFGLTPAIAGAVDDGDFTSVATRSNWIWSIPDTGSAQDNLMIPFPDPPSGLIERVEVFLLLNQVLPSGDDSTPVNPPPLLCSPDPATELSATIRYQNSQNLQREFTQNIAKDDIWQQTADFTAGTPWDTVSSIGNGLRGSSARWEGFDFILDDVDGKGLDQCTQALFFLASGQGTLNFKKFRTNSLGIFTDACLAEIAITPLTEGFAENEIQSIVLPAPTGGTWTLSFNYSTVETTDPIPWNATATMVRNKLAALPNINSIGNVSVTGSGTQQDPFLVEFTGTLGAYDHKMLVADGLQLTGAATAFVQTIQNGTINERQIIYRNDSSVLADLIIEFGGVTTQPLAYDRPLDVAQAALEGLASIGAGNVLVTGATTDREAPYSGPLTIDFVGTLGGQNVPLMSVSPSTKYTVVQSWMGGPSGGANEIQRVTVEAMGGSFVLRIFDTGTVTSGMLYADTAQIPFNATADEVKNALVNAAFWLSDTTSQSDLKVTALTGLPADTYEWDVEWIGSYARTDIPQMQADPTGSQLLGGDIDISEVVQGSGTNERQRLQIISATSGFFKLSITIDGQTDTTTAIPWNTTAAGLEAQILQLKFFNAIGQVAVKDEYPFSLPPSPINSSYIVVFQKIFGDVLMEADFQESLLCNEIILPVVPPGPYEYPLQDCDELDDISCQSGPLLCKPGEGGEFIPEVDCCDNETIKSTANISRRLQIERDLFDPNRKINGERMTLKDLALIKGIKTEEYTPYLRNWNTKALSETTWDREVETKLSFVLLEKGIDTLRGRQRVLNHIGSHREILPARFVWPESTF